MKEEKGFYVPKEMCKKVDLSELTKPTLPKDEIIINNPRRNGRTIESISWFIAHSKLGESIVYSMPEGDILSPKALANKLAEERNKILEIIKDLEVCTCGGNIVCDCGVMFGCACEKGKAFRIELIKKINEKN